MNKKLLSIVLLGLALVGCGSKYKVCPLKYIKHSKADFVQKRDDVEVRVQRLTSKQVGKIASGQRNPSWFVPLLITIKNTSIHTVCLSEKNIKLPLVSAEEISHYLSKSIGRPLVTGLALIPLIFIGTVASFWGIGLLFGECAAFLFLLPCAKLFWGLPIIVGASVYKASEVPQFNEQLSKDLKRKIVLQHCIEPNKKESVLLFAHKKDLQESFEMTLLKGEEKVPFNINLKK